MPNIPLLVETMRHINALPASYEAPPDGDTWNQGLWYQTRETEQGEICGTAACFAGWATMIGAHAKIDKVKEVGYCMVTKDGDVIWDIRKFAMDLLDIDDYTADRLFEGNNDIDDLNERVADLTGKSVEDLQPVSSRDA